MISEDYIELQSQMHHLSQTMYAKAILDLSPTISEQMLKEIKSVRDLCDTIIETAETEREDTENE